MDQTRDSATAKQPVQFSPPCDTASRGCLPQHLQPLDEQVLKCWFSDAVASNAITLSLRVECNARSSDKAVQRETRAEMHDDSFPSEEGSLSPAAAVGTDACASDNRIFSPEQLLNLLEKVQNSLRRKGFSEHAIDQGVNRVYEAAIPLLKEGANRTLRFPHAWVYQIAIRAARSAASHDIPCEPLGPSALVATEKNADLPKEFIDIEDALKQLSPKQRDAIDLVALQGMSYREAARAMGIAPGTVGDRLQSAKKRLAEIFSVSPPSSAEPSKSDLNQHASSLESCLREAVLRARDADKKAAAKIPVVAGHGEFWKLLKEIEQSDGCVWEVARVVECTEEEKAMIVQVAAPHLSGTTSGSVLRRPAMAK